MKTVAVIQSNYIPWKGYFDIIHDADLFIFHDDVKYTKNDWRNRNKIKTANGTSWITVPAGSNDNRLICEVTLPAGDWQEKHWNAIRYSYSNAPHFRRYSDFFESVYMERRWENLSELNQYLIKAIASGFLGITTEYHDSREYRLEGKRLDRLIQLVTKAGASTYVSGPTAKDYIDLQRFTDAGIELVYKSYAGYPEYPQLFPPFDHAVSIIDLLFNVGPDAPRYIWGWRTAIETPQEI
jgi:hypothetical protein